MFGTFSTLNHFPPGIRITSLHTTSIFVISSAVMTIHRDISSSGFQIVDRLILFSVDGKTGKQSSYFLQNIFSNVSKNVVENQYYMYNIWKKKYLRRGAYKQYKNKINELKKINNGCNNNKREKNYSGKNIFKKYCYYYLISLAITLFKRSRYSLFRYYLLPKTVPPLCIFNC